MRTRTWFLAGILGVASAAFVVWSLSSGQEGTSPSPPPPKASLVAASPARDVAKLPMQERQFSLSAQRGAEWLRRINRADGRFLYGYLPALGRATEEDDYLTQAGAAFALARAARHFGDSGGLAVAQQALLTLLIDTAVDAKAPALRYPTLPPALVNRLAAAGMIVAAIHELPQPRKDLLDNADQLCNYIAQTQQTDGSLKWLDSGDAKNSPFFVEGTNLFPGPALYAIARSQRVRPAPWKLDLLRKARAYYLTWWREHKSPGLIPWHSAAYAEAYALTKEQAFADAVIEMNDWLCTLQYAQADPRQPRWRGGFMAWQGGKPVMQPPTAQTAFLAGSLVDACRVARQAADVSRLHNYRQALEPALQFVVTLQYTESNTRHYADWYRQEVLLGSFHASPLDGNLRLDYTAQAVAALAHFLEHVAEAPRS